MSLNSQEKMDRLGSSAPKHGPFEVVYDAKWDKELPWCVMNKINEVVNHFVEKKYADKYTDYLNQQFQNLE